MTRLLATAFMLLLLVVPAAADTLTLPAFFGKFAGSGIAESYDNVYAPETVRDLDVVIAPSSSGAFSITWTTVVRKPSGEAKRKTDTLTFTPSGGTRYESAERRDPYSADGLAWAGIKERTLSVHILSIDTAGGYQLQTYARTLTGLGMELEYTRKVDGEDKRVVKARLVKNAD